MKFKLTSQRCSYEDKKKFSVLTFLLAITNAGSLCLIRSQLQQYIEDRRLQTYPPSQLPQPLHGTQTPSAWSSIPYLFTRKCLFFSWNSNLLLTVVYNLLKINETVSLKPKTHGNIFYHIFPLSHPTIHHFKTFFFFFFSTYNLKTQVQSTHTELAKVNITNNCKFNF